MATSLRDGVVSCCETTAYVPGSDHCPLLLSTTQIGLYSPSPPGTPFRRLLISHFFYPLLVHVHTCIYLTATGHLYPYSSLLLPIYPDPICCLLIRARSSSADYHFTLPPLPFLCHSLGGGNWRESGRSDLLFSVGVFFSSHLWTVLSTSHSVMFTYWNEDGTRRAG